MQLSSCVIVLLICGASLTLRCVDGQQFSVTTDGCSTTKQCFLNPAACSNGNCKAMLTWQPNGDYVDFELMSVNNKWVALGLSTDKSMGLDSVIACSFTPPSTVVVQHWYTTPSFSLTTVNNQTVGISAAQGQYIDGTISCRLKRQITGLGDPKIYDLSQAFYLFLGYGSTDSSGNLQQHVVVPMISNDKITLAPKSLNGTVLVTTDGCGVTKGCIHFPLGCMSPNCEAILTWQGGISSVDFELMAVTDGWVAVGLSFDTLMTNDSVVYCLKNNSIGLAFNPSQYVEYISNPGDGTLRNMASSYYSGQVHCRFTRSIQSTSSWKIFPLNNPYYLLLGLGPLDDKGLIAKHRKDPFVSAQPVSVTTDFGDNIQPTRPPSNTGGAVPTTLPNAGIFTADNPQATVAFTYDGSSVNIQMWGPSGASYVAVGFSNDKKMGDDSVIACSSSSSGVLVQHWFTPGYSINIVDDPTNGITVVDARIIDGRMYCQFKRQISVQPPNPKVYDMNQDYHLLLAYGTADASGILLKHRDNPSISADKINVTNFAVQASSSNKAKSIHLLRAHGCLMITAWILLVSPSIILARYFKTAFPGLKICATAIWFAVHRFLMLLALACTLTGFIIIFAYVNRSDGKMATFNEDYPTYFWVHGPLGIIVMILVIINPIVAAVRCGPDSKYRPIFNWIHWMIGTCCYIIAMITIFFGAKMGEAPDATLHISHRAVFWILIAFTAYHCVTEILLIIHKFIEEDYLKRRLNIGQEYELTTSGHSKSKVQQNSATRMGLVFRYIVLALYGIVALTLWLAMIILIGSGNLY